MSPRRSDSPEVGNPITRALIQSRKETRTKRVGEKDDLFFERTTCVFGENREARLSSKIELNDDQKHLRKILEPGLENKGVGER